MRVINEIKIGRIVLAAKHLIKSNVKEVCGAFSQRDTVRVASRKNTYQDRSTPDSELNDDSKRRSMSPAELFFVNAKSFTLPASFSVFSSFFVGALLKRLSRWTNVRVKALRLNISRSPASVSLLLEESFILTLHCKISKWQMRQKMRLRVVTMEN